MVDRCLAISDRFGNCCLVFFDRTSDVDVEPFSANHFSGVVTRVTGHDDDLAGMTLNVDDAVAGAERLVGPADFIEGGGYLFIVLWMFVRQHHSGGRLHGAGS